jgi:hypothetical protein
MVHAVPETLLYQVIPQVGESFRWPNPHKVLTDPFRHFSMEFVHPVVDGKWEEFQNSGNAARAWL